MFFGDLIIDYVWNGPTEALLAALTRDEFVAATSEIRLIQVGESAGSQIALSAAALRSVPLTIRGTAGVPPPALLKDALETVMDYAARGNLRIETECLPLAGVEDAWQRDSYDRRIVFEP